MPEPDPFPSIKTPWDSAIPPSGAGASAGSVPPISITDHTLIRRIGKGSYGEVWLARNVLGVYRAVKIIDRRAFDDDRPFEREFEGMKRFEPVSRGHESQLNILQVGRGPDCFYYVMELADDMGHGTTIDEGSYTPRNLRSELLLRGRLPVDECIRLGLALTTALGHLHRHGLVHRDIKPSNIVFVNGIPKLADIGLVALAESTMSFVGTEGYLPPEGPGSVQADVFSLGKVLYEISTGRDRQQFPELPTGITELPDRAALAEFNEVLLRACAPDVKQRYESAAEMHADLALLQSGKSVARLRAVERRLKFVARAGALVTGIAVLTGAAFLYQQVQTREARRLASENKTLAEAKIQLAGESRRRLMNLQVANGNRLMDEGDISGSLSWFAEALKSTQGDPRSEETQRYRLGTLFRYSPKPVALFVHDAAVSSAWLSPDEQRVTSISTGDNDKGQRVRIWDATTAEVLFTLALTNVIGTTWSRDGRWILTFHDDFSARLWDGFTGKPVGKPLMHTSNVSKYAVSPDGTRAATAIGQEVRIWDVATATLLGSPLRHSNTVQSVAFSHDGSRIVTGSGNVEANIISIRNGEARVWNTTTGEPVTGWLEQDQPVGIAGFSPNGRIVVTTGNNDVSSTGSPSSARVWDGVTGRLLCPPLKHLDAILSATFSPDGRHIATASGDRTAIVWNVHTGEPVGPPLKHSDVVLLAVFSPDGRWLATASGTTARLWDVSTGELVTAPLKHIDRVIDVRFSLDGARLITASSDRLVRVWDVTDGEPTLPPFSDPTKAEISSASFSPDGRLVVTANPAGDIQTWRVDTGQRIPFINPEPNDIQRRGYTGLIATFSPDGKRIVAPFGDFTARIWEVDTGKSATPPLSHSNLVLRAAFSPDGRHIVTASIDFTARVWDAATGQPITPPLQHSNRVNVASFSPDGRRVVTASYDKTARLWDASTGAPSTPPLQHDGAVDWAAFSPDGRRVVTGSSVGTLLIWDASTGAKVVGPFKHANTVTDVAFSPDGQRIVTASMDNTARVWDATTGLPMTPPLKHSGFVIRASFSPDGRRVVTASADGTARVWDAMTGEALSSAFKHNKEVLSACFSPDGQRIVTASDDRTAQIWDAPKTDWAVQDVTMFAELLTGGAIDPSGKLAASNPETLEKIWRSLRSKYPQEFNARPADLRLWHRRQVPEPTSLERVTAGLFHLKRLVQLGDTDPWVKEQWERFRLCQIPPRDPTTPANLVDLADVYTHSFQMMPAQDLMDLPQGVHSLAGTTFDLRGFVCLIGPANSNDRLGALPLTTARDIKVGRRCRQLHFLQGIDGGRGVDGGVVARWVIHYADGSVREWPLINGEQVRDWHWGTGAPKEATKAVIAWERRFATKQDVRLFKATWTNPQPDVEITHLDFVFGEAPVRPFVVAITAE